MEQTKVKGVMVWDDTKRLEFLKEMVNTTILTKLELIDGTEELPDVNPNYGEDEVEEKNLIKGNQNFKIDDLLEKKAEAKK